MDVIKTLFGFTHGEKEDFLPDGITPVVDPGLTNEGMARMARLCKDARSVMKAPEETMFSVFSGTGKRHRQIAELFISQNPRSILAAGDELYRRNPVLGGPESLVVLHDEAFVVLADGKLVPKAEYTIPFSREDIIAFLRSPEVPNYAVMGLGRPFFIQLKIKAESGALYRIEIGTEPDEISATPLITGVTLADVSHGGHTV
ncbi:MAG: hypothetical protein WC619_04995 [Patescibacteria group bacterium]